jgi:hypothetical protein
MMVAAADVPLPDESLILHYDFEATQVSGSTVSDLSAKHLNGAIANVANATFVEGRTPGTRAISLPGGAASSTTAPYVTVPNGLFQSATAMTVSSWMKWDGGADFQWLYGLGKDLNNATFLTPSFAGDSKTRSSIKPVNGTAEVGVSGSSKIPVGTWVNVTTTIDQQTITYYLNGISLGTKPATVDLVAKMYSATNTTSGALGKAFWGGHPFFDGAIDDFRVYSQALTPEQVRTLAGDTVPRADFTVDLGTSTGPFHGGASGTLYGVYGEGLPSANLLEAIKLRTVSTKAQDGPQHPGADALEVVKPLADASNGDVYIYMTDIYRGFPYQWPGNTPEERLNDYKAKVAAQVDQVLQLPVEYRDNIVFVPYNEPEGNMFGTSTWSYNNISWLNDPQYFFKAWDDTYKLIRAKMPAARIGGPNTSTLYNQVQGFLQHTVAAGTVPDVMTWHELSAPQSIRSNVARYRGWENTAFAGTALAGKHLPININEYAFNYHTSVPGQMIQWFSAIEDSKVDGDIAYWNIDGNLSDSAVQANRANGQWWLLNAYAQMSGDTVKVTPPKPNVSYTLQGVATLDKAKAQSRILLGGTSGNQHVQVNGVDPAVFGSSVHALVTEIGWSGQLGDSAQPSVVGQLNLPVTNGSVGFDFGAHLPALNADSSYQIILTPGAKATTGTPATTLWKGTYEAENAAFTGTGYTKNGPEGTPSNVSKFYTSGNYDVGGLRTGSDVKLNFDVTVPQNGDYDLSVFANSLNTYGAVQEQGPTNVFLTVDGGAEQEMYMPLGYKWVVWDHADTKVKLTAGKHTISLSAKNLAGTKGTKGDAIVDKIDLSLKNSAASQTIYEGENATLKGAAADYTRTGVSGSGTARISQGQSATFWVYSAADGEAELSVDVLGTGTANLSVNGQKVAEGITGPVTKAVFLAGGINKVQVTGDSGTLYVDRVRTGASTGKLASTTYEAETATLSGSAAITSFLLASGGKAVTNVGGDPNNTNTLTFGNVQAPEAGTYALTVRYSNQEQSPATHYNPDPLARHAEIQVNGGTTKRGWFPHSFHADNFWELTIPVELKAGTNTIRFSSQELPNFNSTELLSASAPELLRSKYAPNIDRIRVTALKSPN